MDKISPMVSTYFKIALRHFRRNRFVSLINLTGLSLGLATCLVAGLYIKYEVSADRFHEDLHSIYRVIVDMKKYSMNGTPYLFTETAKAEIQGVKDGLRTADINSKVRIGDEETDHKVILADPGFLSFFTFPLAEGNREKALSGLRQVVLSHEMKERYFPNESALGRTIRIQIDDVFHDFEISGVAKATPAYSSMYFDFVIPLENRYVKDPASKTNWGMFFVTSFLKVEGGKLSSVESAMPDFVLRHIPEEKGPDGKPNMNFKLQPYADHHLSEGWAGGGLREGNNKASLWVFGGIATLILLLACFNFMNLTSAQSSRRSVEVGIKKVIGAGRSQLIRQFLSESLLMSLFAAVLALGIAELCLFAFAHLLRVNLSVFDTGNTDIYGVFIFITVVTGLLAGSYPAFLMSSLNALGTFKRHFRIGGSNWITRTVLSLQFGLSIVLIISAAVMWKQQKFISQKDLGYNQEQVVVIPISNKDTASAGYLKNEIGKLSYVQRVTKASSHFTDGANATIHQSADKRTFFIHFISIDEDFFPTMQMKLVGGTAFDGKNHRRDGIIVNETFVRELGLKDSLGVQLRGNIGFLSQPTIVGVVKDFHHSAINHKILPLMFLYERPSHNSYLLVRLQPGKTSEALARIRGVWQAALPDTPFEFSFQDENVQKQYEREVRWSSIITLATGMAIFLSMLGLLGLAMFTAEQRKKEIGIRKVLGASITQVVQHLSKDYLWLIAIAFLIAIPVSYYLMTNYWLNNFEYRTEFDLVVCLIALGLVLVISVLAIGSQMVKAALQNPALTLKEE